MNRNIFFDYTFKIKHNWYRGSNCKYWFCAKSIIALLNNPLYPPDNISIKASTTNPKKKGWRKIVFKCPSNNVNLNRYTITIKKDIFRLCITEQIFLETIFGKNKDIICWVKITPI